MDGYKHKKMRGKIVSRIFLLLVLRMTVLERMNKAIDEILHHDNRNGTTQGRVCLVCDKLMKRNEAKTMSLKVFVKNSVYFKGRN